MKPKHVAFAVILFAVVIAGSSSAGATDRSPVSIHINLDATKVIAGHAIHGTAVLTNASRKTILVESCAIDGWLDVGLANKSVQYEPISPAIACAPSVKLKPGVNTFPITVQTIYQVCYQKHLKPRCTKTGMPALPKGTYHVDVVTAGLPKGTISTSPTSVTLR
jgi:hypothetical protein